MRAVYSKDIVEAIKSCGGLRGVLYDAILALVGDDRPWTEASPHLMVAYRENHQISYYVPNYGAFHSTEIMVLLGLKDVLREMLRPISSVITLLNAHRSAMFACAAWCNNTEIFQMCFNQYAPYYAQNAHLALCYALQNGNVQILSNIGDISIRNNREAITRLSSSLYIAYVNGHVDAIKLMMLRFHILNEMAQLVERAAMDNNIGFFNQLYDEHNTQYCMQLFSRPIRINRMCSKENASVTPIATAAMMGSWDVVRFLFDVGVPLQISVTSAMQGYYGHTVLHTIYNCHLPQDIEVQKPLVVSIYDKLQEFLEPKERIFFAKHFGIESKGICIKNL